MKLEKIVIPLAQFTKFYYWLLLFYIFSVRIRSHDLYYLSMDPFWIFFPILVAEFIVGIAALFPREESYTWVLIIMLASILFGGPQLAVGISMWLRGGSVILDVLVRPDILILLLICTITAVEFPVMRDKKIRKRYNVRF